MALFQKVIVKKYLKNLPSDLIDERYKKYSEHFHDFEMAERVKALKEEQYQEGFLRDLFVQCLGYTINPFENFNLTTEFKNKTDAEKADGAILKDGNPIAVIELKSTKTKDLKTIEKQAFNYKAHQTNCKYVITSNFEKIRLYINDATEFEEFNVFQLSENDFKFLYLCLSKDSILNDIPYLMKEKSNQHEDLISKKLYNDYSDFRNNIFQNLIKNNPQIDKLILFKKSQKLLDRFLFIFFCEDKGLIPPNLIFKIINDYKTLKDLDAYTPLYKLFTKYFGYINKGYEKLSIDAYNGGLFQFDEILDNVKIDDEILIDDSVKLSNYDFDSEIDVNILGHIFEHSLTDIEKINAEISGENLDKKQTRRKKEGVFYTPDYITKYIVENTIGTLCNEKKEELNLTNIEVDETYFKKSKNALTLKGVKLFETLEIYKNWLLSLKILDPACGSGAFLNQALNFLIDEHNFIIEFKTDLRKGQYFAFDIDTAVLENNLYGVDINEESVEIAKLSLWLKTAKNGRKLTDLSNHIKCGNSLIDDPQIAGDKAFDWNFEFPEIMQKGGFDVVIGNPPYVPGKSLSVDNKNFFRQNYPFLTGKYDLYILFIIKALNLTNSSKMFSLIIPNTFLVNENATLLRRKLIDDFSIEKIRIFKDDVFPDANVESIVVCSSTLKKHNKILLFDEQDAYIGKTSIETILLDNYCRIQINVSNEDLNVLRKINNNTAKLNEIADICIGIQIGGSGNSKDFKEKYISNFKQNETFKKAIDGKDFDPYHINWRNKYISYGDWLHRKRDEKFFLKSKILIRQIGSTPVSIIDKEQFYTLNTIYNLIIKENCNDFVLEYIFLLLNSKIIKYYWNKLFSDNKTLFPKIKKSQLIEIPISVIPIESQQPFIEKADLMLYLTKQKHDKINNFLHRLETNFEIEKLGKKIQNFYDFDFKTLLSELKKKKVKLSFSQQDEFEKYFNNYTDEINELQRQIDKTDKEIDQMVYELYGLTKEEIEIVEKG
ncbi:MAG: hypothetical protein APR54_02945 [Candidatus Cloacimonas sp. SDB]|nr:MAG: hypothetical protein APR54_02945 [Candidatus Cloacimonas sp. SDB]